MKKRIERNSPQEKTHRIGNTTRYMRNGIVVERVAHSDIKSNSAAQKEKRSQFGKRLAVMAQFAGAFKYGFEQLRRPNQTGYNSGVQFNSAHALNDGVLDLNLLKLSQGPLPCIAIESCKVENGMLKMEWSAQPSGDKAQNSDRVFITVARDDMAGRPILSCRESLMRNTGRFEMPLPKDWNGKALHVYVFLYKEDLSMASDTMHINL